MIGGHYNRDHPSWHQMDCDHGQMMRTAMQLLAGFGRTRLAYLGFDNDQNREAVAIVSDWHDLPPTA